MLRFAVVACAVLVLATCTTTKAQESTHEDFKQWGEAITGRWVGDITLIADWEWIGKNAGEKVVSYHTTKWVADGHALLAETFIGEGTRTELHFWDPSKRQIRLRAVTSSGQSWEAVVWKKNDNVWRWKLKGSLKDRTEQRCSGVVAFKEGSYVVEGESTLGDKKLLPLRDVLKRVGPSQE